MLVDAKKLRWLGIDMCPRWRRRVVVVLTYAVFLVGLWIHPRRSYELFVLMAFGGVYFRTLNSALKESIQMGRSGCGVSGCSLVSLDASFVAESYESGPVGAFVDHSGQHVVIREAGGTGLDEKFGTAMAANAETFAYAG